jgi:hypothetical protein
MLAGIRAPREDACLDCQHTYYCKGCYLRGFLMWRRTNEKCRWGLAEQIGERISCLGGRDEANRAC